MKLISCVLLLICLYTSFMHPMLRFHKLFLVWLDLFIDSIFTIKIYTLILKYFCIEIKHTRMKCITFLIHLWTKDCINKISRNIVSKKYIEIYDRVIFLILQNFSRIYYFSKIWKISSLRHYSRMLNEAV